MFIWIARIFGLGALAVLISDGLAAFSGGSFRLTALGEWWFWAHKDSLQVLQPAIERHVDPLLPFSIWDPGVQSLLEWPFAAELGALAAIAWIAARVFR
ncbi:MAG: hypothetical protein AAGD13_21000 [Pseudomonadota bacterium]